MEKKDDASLTASRAQRPPIPTHPPYIEMVQKALMEHGGEEGLTAEEINECLIAANYDLPHRHDLLLAYYLNQLTKRNNIIQDPSSGRYTIPGRAEVKGLRSQAEEVLCKLKKAEDQYIKNLAGPFVKEHHLSKIKKVKAFLAEANTSRGFGGFKIPTATHGEFKKPTSTHGGFKKPTSTHGASDKPVGTRGPAVSRAGPIEPSHAVPERSACGKVTVRIKLPESGSRPSDKLNNRESENK